MRPYLPKARPLTPRPIANGIRPLAKDLLSEEAVRDMSEIDRFRRLKWILERSRISLASFIQRSDINGKRFYRYFDYMLKNPYTDEFPDFSRDRDDDVPIEKIPQADEKVHEAVSNYLVTEQFPQIARTKVFLETPAQQKTFLETFEPGNREVVLVDLSTSLPDKSVKGAQKRGDYLIWNVETILEATPNRHHIFFGDAWSASVLEKRKIIPTAFFVLDAGDRTHTEDLIQAAVSLYRRVPNIKFVYATKSKQERVTNQWIPLNAFQYRQIPTEVILDGVRMSYQEALEKIPYPSEPIQKFVQDLSISIDDADPERTPDELRNLFIQDYPPDLCLNEFALAYGISGLGLEEWIHQNRPFGDGPEAVRVFLGSKIQDREVKPSWLLTSAQDIHDYIEKIPPKTLEIILADEDNVFVESLDRKKDPLAYVKKPHREILLFGNDITLRGIYDQLDKMTEQRKDIHFILTCDSAKEAADIELISFIDLLEKPKRYGYVVVSRDNRIKEYVTVMRDRYGFYIEAVDFPPDIRP